MGTGVEQTDMEVKGGQNGCARVKIELDHTLLVRGARVRLGIFCLT